MRRVGKNKQGKSAHNDPPYIYGITCVTSSRFKNRHGLAFSQRTRFKAAMAENIPLLPHRPTCPLTLIFKDDRDKCLAEIGLVWTSRRAPHVVLP